MIITELINSFKNRSRFRGRRRGEAATSIKYIIRENMEKMVPYLLPFYYCRKEDGHSIYHELSITAANIHSALFIFITSCIT